MPAADEWKSDTPLLARALGKRPEEIFQYVDQGALQYEEKELNMLCSGGYEMMTFIIGVPGWWRPCRTGPTSRLRIAQRFW